MSTGHREESDTIGVREFARILGLDKDSVYQGIKAGELPGYYVGKRVRIGKDAVESYLAGRWTPPRQEAATFIKKRTARGQAEPSAVTDQTSR